MYNEKVNTKMEKLNSLQQLFLAEANDYFASEPTKNNLGMQVSISPDIPEEKRHTLRNIADSPRSKIQFFKPNTFRLYYDEVDSSEILYLHQCDLEDGGPQPRTKIDLSNPETAALYQSIEAKGQLEPIKVYPSPTTPGKYRIFDGHQRHMILFTMLMKSTIKANYVNCTEQQAYENALTLNSKRQNLTSYEQGRYIAKVLLKRFPEHYSLNQEALGKRLGSSQQSISLILKAYNAVEAQKGNLDSEVYQRLVKMSASKIEAISKAPEELKAAIYKNVLVDEKDLTREDIKTLVKEINAVPNATEKTVEEKIKELTKDNPDPDATPVSVAEEAKKIADEKAQGYMKDADRATAKTERARDKVVEVGSEYPEGLMTTIFGHLGIKGMKVTPEKAKVYASIVVGVLFQRALDRKELDEVLAEADTWQ